MYQYGLLRSLKIVLLLLADLMEGETLFKLLYKIIIALKLIDSSPMAK